MFHIFMASRLLVDYLREFELSDIFISERELFVKNILNKFFVAFPLRTAFCGRCLWFVPQPIYMNITGQQGVGLSTRPLHVNCL